MSIFIIIYLNVDEKAKKLYFGTEEYILGVVWFEYMRRK
jgi:hypothetical protein